MLVVVYYYNNNNNYYYYLMLLALVIEVLDFNKNVYLQFLVSDFFQCIWKISKCMLHYIWHVCLITINIHFSGYMCLSFYVFTFLIVKLITGLDL